MKKDLQKNKSEEVLTLTAKILRLFYIVMIISLIFVGTILIKEWGILTFIGTVLKVASPLFIGLGIAWLFNPFVNILVDKGLKRILATGIVYLSFLIIAYIFMSLLIPTLYNQIIDFIGTIPDILNNIEKFITNIFSGLSGNNAIDIEGIKMNVIDSVQNYGNSMMENLPDMALSFVRTLFSGLGTMLFSLMIGFYLLFDFENVKENFINLFPSKEKKTAKDIMYQIGDELRKYVNGQLLCALIVLVLCFLGFAIFGLKNPLLFGTVCGVFDLILIIGPWIAGIIAGIVGFTQSPFIGIMVIIVVLFVQQCENIFIRPMILSKSNNLHPVIIVTGLLIFGYYFGIWGVILATPIIAVFKIAFKYINNRYQFFKTKGAEQE